MKRKRMLVQMAFLSIIFFAMKLEAAPKLQPDPKDYKLDPRHYDIFHGKKDAIYLSGGDWKLKLLPNTKNNPKNDLGTKDGFMKPDFDDSKWPAQVVPWDWRRYYPPGKDWNAKGWCAPKPDAFSGVGWYRKTFEIPESAKGKRFLLWFGGVDNDCVVYLNGKKVGTHQNYVRRWATARGYDAATFEFDVTDAALPGEKNVLAVRVFDEESLKKESYNVAGICKPVILKIESPIYARDIKVVPRFADSAIEVTCVIINPTDKKIELEPVAEILDYKSDRYEPKYDGTSQETVLPKVDLKPGRNNYKFKVKLDDPISWSFIEPHLYLLRLTAERDGEEELLGLARFGFREIKVVGNRFFLNGKPMRLRGQNAPVPWASVRPDMWANQDNCLGKKTRFMTKDLNLTWARLCSSPAVKAYFEVSDELGNMINMSFRPYSYILLAQRKKDNSFPWAFKNYETSEFDPVFLEKYLRPFVNTCFNHPSVIMYFVMNEPYDGPKVTLRDALAAARDELKKEDATRLCASYSGRWPGRDVPVPTDFWDVHDYTGSINSLPYPWLPGTLKKFHEGYKKAENLDIPMVNGEGMYPIGIFTQILGKSMDLPVGKKAPKSLTKKQYVDAFAKIIDNYKKALKKGGQTYLIGDALSYVQRYTLLDTLSAGKQRNEMEALGYKRMIEIHRWSDDCEGFNIQNPHTILPLPQKAIWTACQPLLACSTLFDENLTAGGPLKMDLRVINDSISDKEDLELQLDLMDLEGKKSILSKRIEVGDVKVGDRKKFPLELTIPAELATGRYKIALKLNEPSSFLGDLLSPFSSGDSDKSLSENDYEVFIAGEKDIHKHIDTKKRVGLCLTKTKPAKRLIKILDSLGVKYTPVKDWSKLDDFDVLFIAGLRDDNRKDSECALLNAVKPEIKKWVEKGGRLVSMVQHSTKSIPALPTSKIKHNWERIFTELVVPEHPLFKNIPQKCWNSWNGPQKCIYKSYIVPLSESVLARGGDGRRVFGMPIAEAKSGEGVVLAEQTKALEKYDSDPVAKLFIQNMLEYTLGDNWDGSLAGVMRGTVSKEDTRTFKVKNPVCLNLAKVANQGLKDEVDNDGKGGWTDHGKFDLRHFPVGKQTFKGVPFEIVDPAKNNDKSVIVLKGKHRKHFPEKVTIPAGTRANTLYFLVTSEWCRKGKHLDIHVNYEGGTGHAARRTLTLERGVNIQDWSKAPFFEMNGAVVGWNGTHPVTGMDTHVFIVPWTNPEPNVPITHIDLESEGNGVPIILGITADAP